MAMWNLKDAFVEELRDMLSAERQITKALPKLVRTATQQKLKEAFEHHLQQTREHVTRVEQALEAVDVKPRAQKCEAMEGLLKEGEEVISSDAENSVLDARLIAAAQKVEHYEIATYGTLCTWGEILELDEAVELLKQNLDEEKTADEKLTALAKRINAAAASPA